MEVNQDLNSIIKLQSVLRAFIVMRRLANKIRRHAKRTRVVVEIIDVESDYLNSISAAVKVFLEPIDQQNLLTSQEQYLLFSNIKKIAIIHEAMLSLMHRKFENWKYSDGISDLLTPLLDNISEYAEYIENFQKATDFLKEKENDNLLHKFILKASQAHECKGLDLISILIQPIQRLPRYVLLLKEYMKYMDENHADYHATNGVIERLEKELRKINDNERTTTKVEYIIHTVEGGAEVDFNGSDYIMEGSFSEKQKWNCEIYAFLFRNVILYAKSKSSPNFLEKFFNTHMYKFHLRSAIYIRDVIDICIVDAEKGFENSLALKTTQGVLLFQAKTKRQRDQWHEEISSVIKMHNVNVLTNASASVLTKSSASVPVP